MSGYPPRPEYGSQPPQFAAPGTQGSPPPGGAPYTPGQASSYPPQWAPRPPPNFKRISGLVLGLAFLLGGIGVALFSAELGSYSLGTYQAIFVLEGVAIILGGVSVAFYRWQ